MSEHHVSPDELSLAERCKLLCEYPGGSPCGRSDCPRLSEQAAQVTREACEAIGTAIKEVMQS